MHRIVPKNPTESQLKYINQSKCVSQNSFNYIKIRYVQTSIFVVVCLFVFPLQRLSRNNYEKVVNVSKQLENDLEDPTGLYVLLMVDCTRYSIKDFSFVLRSSGLAVTFSRHKILRRLPLPKMVFPFTPGKVKPTKNICGALSRYK